MSQPVLHLLHHRVVAILLGLQKEKKDVFKFFRGVSPFSETASFTSHVQLVCRPPFGFAPHTCLCNTRSSWHADEFCFTIKPPQLSWSKCRSTCVQLASLLLVSRVFFSCGSCGGKYTIVSCEEFHLLSSVEVKTSSQNGDKSVPKGLLKVSKICSRSVQGVQALLKVS